MSLPDSSPLLKLGYLKPVEFPSITTPTMPSSTEEPLTFPVCGSKVPTGNILEQLAQADDSPVFTTPPIPERKLEEERSDVLMDRLLREGFLIEYQLYEGGKLSYFLTSTKRGDRALIQIDSTAYLSTFQQIVGSCPLQLRRSTVTLVPQTTKLGALRCLEYDICGVAFICDESLCVSTHEGDEPTELNFIFQGDRAGRLGHTLVALPIVKLSFVLEKPKEAEEQIALASEELYKASLEKLQEQHREAKETLDRLASRVVALRKFTDEFISSLDGDIKELSEMYTKLGDLSPDELSEQKRNVYYTVLRGLAEKKSLRARLTDSVSSAYSSVKQVQATVDEIDRLIDPLIEEFVKTKGKV